MKIKDRYTINKSAKVGDTCTCPSCGSTFIKSSYQQAFCKTKGGTVCKDKYWNTVISTKRNNKTRISPASAAWLSSQEPKRKQKQRPQAWEVFGVWHDDDWCEGDGGSGCST